MNIPYWSPAIVETISYSRGCGLHLSRSSLYGMQRPDSLITFFSPPHLLRLKMSPSLRISTTCSTLAMFPTFTILMMKSRSWQPWSLLYESWGCSPPRPTWWLHTQDGFAATSTWSCAWGIAQEQDSTISVNYSFPVLCLHRIFASQLWKRNRVCILPSPRRRCFFLFKICWF